jgi:hypothetical protein
LIIFLLIALVVGFPTTVQLVSITTKVVSLNPTHGEVHSIQHFVSDLQYVGGFLQVLGFPPPIKRTTEAVTMFSNWMADPENYK